MSEQKLTRRQKVENLLQDPNMKRFLDVLAYTEGTQKNGYYTKYGGGKINDLSWHPNKVWGRTGDGNTTATGRYQFLSGTWKEHAKLLGLKDFGPQSQDLAAVSLIMQNGAVNDILRGDIDSANRKLSKIWASLPYNKSPHQSQKSVEDVAKEWERLGGKDYSMPSLQNDYIPPKNIAQQTQTFAPPQQSTTSKPLSLAEQFANFGNPQAVARQVQNPLESEPLKPFEPLQNYRKQYQKQLASAFGIEPETQDQLPNYIGDLVKSIYDQTA